MSKPRLLIQWIVGLALGTALIAATSPFFVRSYVPLSVDQTRNVWTMPPGRLYRWRSEGYANTSVGPLGMPGKTELPPRDERMRVALWGDSQAEGVCVVDHQKLFHQTEIASGNKAVVFPLVRSGEDAATWLTQMPRVEAPLAIDAHVFLIVDLPDLQAAISAPIDPPSEADIQQANAALASRLPAFVIQTARHLLYENDGATRRQLRFSIGPIQQDESNTQNAASANNGSAIDWSPSTRAVRRTTNLPVVIIYAPILPQIFYGKLLVDDPNEDSFSQLRKTAEQAGIAVIDMRPTFRESMQDGAFAHGYHNGLIGNGHLNATGYKLVAEALATTLAQIANEGE